MRDLKVYINLVVPVSLLLLAVVCKAQTPTPAGAYNDGLNGSVCPPLYEVFDMGGSKACRPILPSSEFYREAVEGYPACALGYPVVSASNFQTLDLVSWNSPPNSSIQVDSVYKYAVGGSTDPKFVYSDVTNSHFLTHCTCKGANSQKSALPLNTTPPNFLSTTDATIFGNSLTGSRFVPDTYDVINSKTTSTPLVEYSAVQMAFDSISNGYDGSVASYDAACACPNLNEQMLDTYSLASTDPAAKQPFGTVCKSVLNLTDVDTKNNQLLVTYSPQFHSSHLIPGAPNNGLFVAVLPNKSGGYQKYARKIWTCAPPFNIKQGAGITGECKFDPAFHSCSAPSDTNLSSVGRNITGITQTKFWNTVNKKLACCMNSFDPFDGTSSQTILRYDCIQNSEPNKYTDFNDLWSKTDSDQDGGQPNAIMLANSSGDPVTGFYGLDGVRCADMSEFAGVLRPTKVNQTIKGTQQDIVGFGSKSEYEYLSAALPTPASASYANAGIGGLGGKIPGIGKGIPDTAAKMRRCPVLARAAIIVKCHDDTTDPNIRNASVTPITYNANYVETVGVKTQVRCPAAETITIHLRVEQIYQIAGLPVMKTLDSFLDPSQAIEVSVGSMIRDKTLGYCPGGMTIQPDGTCLYQ